MSLVIIISIILVVIIIIYNIIHYWSIKDYFTAILNIFLLLFFCYMSLGILGAIYDMYAKGEFY